MWSIKDYGTLGSAIARIVPGEEAAHPLVVGVGDYLLERLAADPATQHVVQAGLLLLQTRGFDHQPGPEQDAILAELEAHPSIALLIRLCVEGYYTSPAGLAAVGFRVTA